MMSITLWFLTLMVPLQIFLGDAQGLNTLHHQPAKLAAIEAHWNARPRAPLTLFAIRTREAKPITSPSRCRCGSLILTHDVNAWCRASGFPPQDRAPAIIPSFPSASWWALA